MSTVAEAPASPIDIMDIDLENHPALEKAVLAANALTIDDRDIGVIDIVGDSGCIMYAVRGPVDPHEDMDYWPWSHIIVLRSSRALFQTRTYANRVDAGRCQETLHKAALKPGTVMIFNGHDTHWVDQDDDDLLVWLSVRDLPCKMTLSETIETAEAIESDRKQIDWAELNAQHLIPQSPMALIQTSHPSKV